MSVQVFIGIGAGIGAVCGGAAGFFAKNFFRGGKKVDKKSKPVPSTQPALPGPTSKSPVAKPASMDAVVAAPAAATPAKPVTPKPTKPQRELFDVKVQYFTPASEFYTMLVRFENYLQFATERDSFKSVVEHIDNLLGMDALLHGRNPVSRAALPTLAEAARRKILHILTDIIAFSNEERPSKTKEESMNAIKQEINQAMLAIVKDMNRVLASMPIVIKK